MSTRPASTTVYAIRRKADGLYFFDIACEFFPLHPLSLFERRARAEGRMMMYLDDEERAGCEVVEFQLIEVKNNA